MDEKEYRQYSIAELKLADEDLQMNLTMGVTVAGTYLDLLRLKKYLVGLPDFKVIYNTISSSQLRVVKVDEWSEFVEWKKGKNS
jgi:hypothetical protein